MRKRKLDEQKGSQSGSDGGEETKKSKTDEKKTNSKKEKKDDEPKEIHTKTPKGKKGKSLQPVFMLHAMQFVFQLESCRTERCCMFVLRHQFTLSVLRSEYRNTVPQQKNFAVKQVAVSNHLPDDVLTVSARVNLLIKHRTYVDMSCV